MEAGQELAGRYRLDRRLGHGGMGEVWSATDLRLDRAVAIKVMLVDMTGERAGVALAWFRREGKATARLNHPHIAVIHDAGEHDAHPYLVMELIRGPDLRKLLRDAPGGLPVEVALEYAVQAAEGLAAAHAAGVIHRDVSPANLLLDQAGRVKVCDFGIAALKDGTKVIGETSTVVGNIAYMAPEQFGRQDVTGAADVYALGATLFHLITGRPPFVGEDPRVVMARILMDSPPAAGVLCQDVPPLLDSYLLSMLAKDPRGRPAMHSVPIILRRITSFPYAWADALLAEAESLARNDGQWLYSTPLVEIARTRAVWDAETAERTARRIKYPLAQARALLEVALAVSARDQVRAAGLLTAAEHAARAAEPYRQEILSKIAVAVATRDPAEAVRIAHSLPRDPHPTFWEHGLEGVQSGTLREIAGVVAEQQPDVAQQIASGISDNPYSRALALCAVVEALVKRDPARSITFVSDAEKAVRELPASTGLRVEGLAKLAGVLLDADPNRARRLLAEAESIERSLGNRYEGSDGQVWIDTDGDSKEHRLRIIATAMAPLDPAEAQRIAGSMMVQIDGLTAVAAAAASRNPTLAHSIAVSLAEDFARSPLSCITALVHIARALIDYAPERAAALLAKAENLFELGKAERLAKVKEYEYQEYRGYLHRSYLLPIGEALARINPAEAVRIANRLGDYPYYRTELLYSAARVFSDQDPARAARLLADLERDARRIADSEKKAAALVRIVITQMGSLISHPVSMER